MSAKQPNRKPAGKRKESDASAQEGRERKRAAKRKGLKAGSRQQVEQAGKKSGTKQAKDPRIGSRKPVALIVEEKSSKPVAPKQIKEKKLAMTPEQELASIENDDRLNDLLDRLDAGETLEAAEQAWVDQRVDRYQELMDELGIIDTDDDEDEADFDEADFDEPGQPASEEELWDRFTQVDYQPEPKPEPKKKVMSGWMLAALLGGLILLGLAWYAGTLLARLKRQHDSQQQAIAARNERILESVRVIAHAVRDGQCDYSEGAIRLTNLLDALQIKGGRAFAGEFPGLYGLYEKVKEMPTHEARRALKRNEVMKMDLERSGYEAELEAQILEDVARLKDFQLSR